MELIREEKNDAAFLKIVGDMSIYHATSLRDGLLEQLSQFEEVTLDLTEVDNCDTAGVQLLLAARISAAETGKPFTISGISDSVQEALSRAGITPEGDSNMHKGEE